MPRKAGFRHNEETRAKIQTSMIINRLHDCITGKKELTSVQVNAAKTLLNKILPDLQAIDLAAIIDTTLREVSSKPLSPEEWAAKYADNGSKDDKDSKD